jgi:hypothetical protein
MTLRSVNKVTELILAFSLPAAGVFHLRSFLFRNLFPDQGFFHIVVLSVRKLLLVDSNGIFEHRALYHLLLLLVRNLVDIIDYALAGRVIRRFFLSCRGNIISVLEHVVSDESLSIGDGLISVL